MVRGLNQEFVTQVLQAVGSAGKDFETEAGVPLLEPEKPKVQLDLGKGLGMHFG